MFLIFRHLEAEVAKWQGLVDKVRGDSPPDFDNQTLAVLRGRLVRYLMRSKEITLGRCTKDASVDVDLKLEGPAWKISRRQVRQSKMNFSRMAANSKLSPAGHHQTVEQRRVLHRQRGQEVHIRRRQTGEFLCVVM